MHIQHIATIKLNPCNEVFSYILIYLLHPRLREFEYKKQLSITFTFPPPSMSHSREYWAPDDLPRQRLSTTRALWDWMPAARFKNWIPTWFYQEIFYNQRYAKYVYLHNGWQQQQQQRMCIHPFSRAWCIDISRYTYLLNCKYVCRWLTKLFNNINMKGFVDPLWFLIQTILLW